MRELLPFTVIAFSIGAVAFWWAGRRVTPAVRRARWIKFLTYIGVVYTVLLATAAGTIATTALMALISTLGLWEILRLLPRLTRRVAPIAVLVFVAIAGGGMWLVRVEAAAFIGYLYVVVAVFDGFSQASGQLAGRTKLAPSISPGKTLEGLLIGAAVAIGCAMTLRASVSLSLGRAAAIGVIAAGAGAIGDLAASWVKRRAGIKDYGTLLPGHGGILDRFDSFLTAAATMALVTRIFPGITYSR